MASKKIIPVKDINIEIRKCELCSKLLYDTPSYNAHMKYHGEDCPYACDLCPYKCKVRKYLSRHKRNVHSKEPVHRTECPVCGKTFSHNCKLESHLRVHTGERPYHCDVCSKTFSSSYCLSIHKYIHTDEKPYHCQFCEYACRDGSTLRKHQERHMGIYKMFPCHKCKKNFKSRRNLQLHIDEQHFGLDTRQITCEICNKKYKTTAGKNMHIRTVHDRTTQIPCEICDRLVIKYNMKTHLNSHIDIRPFKCTFERCGKSFKDKGGLQKHILIHYPEKHFQCDLCDAKFSRKSRMKQHRLQHVSNGYTCDYCGGTFTTKTFLQLHITKRHGRKSEKFICNECDSVHFSKRSIIMHLKYGHGCRSERSCRICGDVLQNNAHLAEHYLTVHGVKYVIKNTQGDKVALKKELLEVDVSEQFNFKYDVQKVEIEEHIAALEDPSKIVTYTKNMLEVDLSKSIINTEVTERKFDDFYRRVYKGIDGYIPEYADAETILPYSEKVLEEDISRNVVDRDKSEPNEFEEFFLKKNAEKSNTKDLGKCIVNRTELDNLKKSIDKMLDITRAKKTADVLEKVRQQYNRRIQMAFLNNEKKETTRIKYFKKSEENSTSHDKSEEEDEIDKDHTKNDENAQGDETNKLDDERQKSHREEDSNESQNNLLEEMENNNELVRGKRKRKVISYDDVSVDDQAKTVKLRFDGHECYVCFKVFKTKDDLKIHCKEHFDICNEKMLKKCPFCGYVTDRHLSRHIKLVHDVNIKYMYGHITEKQKSEGSKYVFQIDKDCELEIIPSISNLNKMACMKIDEKKRKNKNLFMGKTKLVRKGKEWVVEKEAIGIHSNNLLPEFTDDEYVKIKTSCDDYYDQLRQLSILAKKHGVKMLFPCIGCEKICQTLSALQLHKRKHEDNPKQYKPKVWINRHIEYTTKNRKKGRRSNTILKNNKENPHRNVSVKVPYNRRKDNNIALEHRYAHPQPVKNNHKCDKKLIEFYKSNIRGRDIEFWQFLKIFNKMNRENVNDFDDLINRDDVHFGLHNRDEFITPVTKLNEPVTSRKGKSNPNKHKKTMSKDIPKPKRNTVVSETVNEHESVINETEIINKMITSKKPVIKTKLAIKKTVNKKLPRVIMISKKENMKRNEIKNQMRQRLAQICQTA